LVGYMVPSFAKCLTFHYLQVVILVILWLV